MSEKVPELTNGEFEEYIKEGVVVVDFFGEWCMPCMTMIPIIDDLAEKYNGKIKFGKVDVSENQEIAKKYSVSSIPNFVVLKDGQPIEQFVGSMNSDDFSEKLDGLL